MRLRKIRVKGFQAFLDSGFLEFADGFNLVIGQNNAGKSSLLRAMLNSLPDDRHRTPEKFEQHQLALPEVDFTIDVSGNEIRDWILRSGSTQHIPVDPAQIRDVLPIMDSLFAQSHIPVTVCSSPGRPISGPYPSHALFQWVPGVQQHTAVLTLNDGGIRVHPGHNNTNDSLPILVWNAWVQDTFYFAAERMSIGEAHHGYSERLLPNASNLPNVLNTLNGDQPDIFSKLVGHLREVFPTVGNLSVRTKPGNNALEVRVWPTEARENVKLSFPLNSSGTGVSQVIALLTAIMTIENAIIIIDEINSFLHPAAVKALLRILQTKYTQRQYIISTHAPEVIGFSHPSSIHLVKRSGYESTVVRLNLAEIGEFREVAEHLGVSMADVFAADRIIWVEGPTEELIFPYLYREMSGQPLPRGTAFISVAATGDFNRKRDREIVYEVYNRLCSASMALVVGVMFSFDTEKLSDVDKEKMVKDAGGRLRFLPRRHLECYLLEPTAIAHMIVAKDPASEGVATPEAVEAKLIGLANDTKFHIEQWNGNLSNENWLAKVDAANLILSATTDISNARATFNKKEDSAGLLRNILSREPQRLSQLHEYIQGLVVAVTSKPSGGVLFRTPPDN